MSDRQNHATNAATKSCVEVWFKIEKDADGYPESKGWEVLFAEKRESGYVIKSVPFYLKNVSVGDTIEASEEEFLAFRKVVARAGHNTYRLLLSKDSQAKADDIANELTGLGLSVEKEIGMLLAIDVPQVVDQRDIEAFLVTGKEEGRWEVQDGCLNGFRETPGV